MGLDDNPTRGSDVRFPTSAPRTDFKDQITGGSTPSSGGETDDDRIHRIVFDATKEAFATPSTYSSEQRDQYREAQRLAVNQIDSQFGKGIVAADLNGRTNWAANHYRITNGRWPTARELIAYGPYQDSLWTFASGATFFDPIFDIRNEDGSRTTYVNSGLTWVALDDQGAYWEHENNRRLPEYTIDQVQDILQSLSPVSQPSGGSGSGGGRAPAAFDRAQLTEKATDRWRGLLLEEPDEATLTQLVSDYIAQANAFWMQDGGSLDFDTFVVNKVRAQDRHTFLYKKKPDFQSESEYMGGFRQTVSQFGMNDRAALRETEAGAHSGVGLAGFGERVEKTREARLINTGTYSQKFAASMAQTGIGRT